MQHGINFWLTKASGEHVAGSSYSLMNGLLDIKMQVHQSKDILEFFKLQMKNISRKEFSPPEDFIKIHRMSRMCWELTMHFRLTNLDRGDIELLYDMPQNDKTEWIFSTLNAVRFQHSVRKTDDASILAADHFAKDLEHLMNS
jgi:hypothetical protein